MGREEVLTRIREAEAERKKTEESAQAEKERLIQQAHADARHVLEEASRAAEAQAAQIVASESSKTKEERKIRVQAGEREMASVREAAQSRVAPAVEKLLKEFRNQASG